MSKPLDAGWTYADRRESRTAGSRSGWGAADVRAFAPPLLLAATVGLALFADAAPARAQVVLFVNGDPITSRDIEQRGKLVQLTLRRTAPREELINDLIDDKIKISVGKRYKLDITDNDVDKQFAEMGGRMHMSRQQFEQVLNQGGVDAATMKEHIKAEISWATVVQGKFQSALVVSEKDVLQAMETGAPKEGEAKTGDAKSAEAKSGDAKPAADPQKVVAYEYTLRPILFVTPRGASPEVIEGRKKDVEALRSRFASCDTGIPAARAMQDVAVRESITKSSADLQPAIREILDGIAVGHLTSPEVTARGVEVFALCAKREAKNEQTGKREAQNRLMNEKFEAQGKRFLAELRKAAMIEYKEPIEPVKEPKSKKGAKPSKESNAKAPGVKTQ
jgi:peptidyl-prolyl cis-trans isomerase SurA